MRHWKTWLYLVAMIAIFGSCYMIDLQNRSAFSGIATENEVASQSESPTNTAAPAAQATVISAGEKTEAPTDSPTETAVAVASEVNQCLDCHTDKAKLIDSAAPEEVVVKESEGAG